MNSSSLSAVETLSAVVGDAFPDINTTQTGVGTIRSCRVESVLGVRSHLSGYCHDAPFVRSNKTGA